MLALPAAAETPPDCGGTQLEMTLCADRTLAHANAAMADALAAARAAATDDEATALIDAAQTAWAAYRDAECAAQADAFRGGSIAPSIALSCADALTRARSAKLRDSAVLFGVDGGATAPDAETFWGVAWSADFDRDGAFDDARLGVRATGDPNGPLDAVLEVAISGAPAPLAATIPVDGDALCGPPLPLRLHYGEPGDAATIVVEDGMCDAFRFRVIGAPPRLEYARN